MRTPRLNSKLCSCKPQEAMRSTFDGVRVSDHLPGGDPWLRKRRKGERHEKAL